MRLTNTVCHCGNQFSYQKCCQPFLSQSHLPENAEQLMRSRFTAFKLRQYQYIIDTQDIIGQPKASLDSFDLSVDWLGLYVLSHITDLGHSKQQVEFVAFFKQHQSEKIEQLHELSDFNLRQQHWVYTSGKPLADYKIPRNTSCFCQSGKKYKKCHAHS